MSDRTATWVIRVLSALLLSAVLATVANQTLQLLIAFRLLPRPA